VARVEAVVDRLRSAGCVFAEDEARLLLDSAQTPVELATMVDRRVAGEPLEHVLGWAEFCGRRIVVDAGVFVPRRRTEFLAQQAIALARPPAVVVDLCCGAGAVAAAVRAAVPTAEVYAADLDPAAVACARRNLPGVPVYQGDLYQALPQRLRGRVDIIVANVPYVPTGELGLLPPEARLHEPRLALDGGPDGLDLVRRLAEPAPRWLGPGGHVLVETSEDQATLAVQAFASNGLLPQVQTAEDLGATVVMGASG
jgi:release factor glutamine methyltransferase